MTLYAVSFSLDWKAFYFLVLIHIFIQGVGFNIWYDLGYLFKNPLDPDDITCCPNANADPYADMDSQGGGENFLFIGD